MVIEFHDSLIRSSSFQYIAYKPLSNIISYTMFDLIETKKKEKGKKKEKKLKKKI